MFIARGKEDALVTLNLVPGEAVYGEKRISIEVSDVWICCIVTIHGWNYATIHGWNCVHSFV